MIRAHPAAIDAIAIVAFEIEVHARDRRHRAGRSEHVNSGRSTSAVLAHEGREQRCDFDDHRFVTLPGHSDPAVSLGKRDDAVRQRNPAANLRQRRTPTPFLRARQPYDFRRAAADIEQDGTVGLRVDQRRAAGGGKPGFRFTVDDLELKAGFLGDAGKKRGAVLRRPAGFGRDQPGAGHALVFHLVAANGERRERPPDSGVAQAARRRDALSQPDDTGKRIDDAETLACGPRHQKPTIVRSEIERRIRRAAPVAAEASIGPPRRPPTPPGAR